MLKNIDMVPLIKMTKKLLVRRDNDNIYKISMLKKALLTKAVMKTQRKHVL
jgi:hypothetical protein